MPEFVLGLIIGGVIGLVVAFGLGALIFWFLGHRMNK